MAKTYRSEDQSARNVNDTLRRCKGGVHQTKTNKKDKQDLRKQLRESGY